MWSKHQKLLEEKLGKPLSIKELTSLLKVHKEKIRYLQHERSMHLFVTLTVAMLTLIMLITTLFLQNTLLLIPDALLVLLVVAYLIYYRKLENTVQRWYGINDEIRDRLYRKSG